MNFGASAGFGSSSLPDFPLNHNLSWHLSFPGRSFFLGGHDPRLALSIILARADHGHESNRPANPSLSVFDRTRRQEAHVLEAMLIQAKRERSIVGSASACCTILLTRHQANESSDCEQICSQSAACNAKMTRFSVLCSLRDSADRIKVSIYIEA